VRDNLRKIYFLLGSDRRKVPGLFLLFLCNSSLDVIGLALVGPYIGLISGNESIWSELELVIPWLSTPRANPVVILGFLLIIVVLIKTVVAIFIQWRVIRFSLQQQLRLRVELMQAYQKMPYTGFLLRNSAEYIYCMQNLVSQYARVVRGLLESLGAIFVSVVIIVFLGTINLVTLALLVILLVISILAYDRVFRERLRRYAKDSNSANILMVKGLKEGIFGLKEIRVLGKEKYFRGKIRHASRQVARSQTRQQLVTALPQYLLELLTIVFVVLVIFSASLSGSDLKSLLPTMGVFGLAALRLIPSASLVARGLSVLRSSEDGVRRLYADRFPQMTEISGQVEHGAHPSNSSITVQTRQQISFESLVVRDITFRYPNAPDDALRGVSIDVYAGESIGVIGRSGSGKTTLVDVILGLLPPKGGRILVDKKRLENDQMWWSEQVAYLPQEIFLLDDSLLRNVALGVEDQDIDKEALSVAITQARLNQLVDALPNGLETRLGEHGVRLSGGQRQRVALARAFYHHRNILIMDEATSSLDNESELEIIAEIAHLKGRVTLIVIAHRLSTVQNCDRIYRLEEGQVAEVGPPQEILVK
jgi:ATP-binding cassette, subfamily B, bacterial PglK